MSTAIAQQIKITLPTSIAGCVVWFDGRDTTTLGISNSIVSTWTSKGTIPLVATSIGGNILYETYNGNLALRFNGSTTKMTTGTISSYGASATTWIACSVNLNPSTLDASVVFASSTSPERSIRYTDGTAQLYTLNNGVLRYSSSTANGIRGFIDTAASFTGYANGSDVTTSTQAVTYQAGANQTFVLGQWNIAYLNGYIQEVIVYNSALSLTQYQQIEGYLAWKWGFVAQLPVNHPYKTNNLWTPIYPSLSVQLPSKATPKQLFTPLQIQNCILWLDGADQGTLFEDSTGVTPVQTSGDLVSFWRDKSASANNATNTFSQPSFLPAGRNRFSVVNFSGAQHLNLTPTKLPNGGTPFSFFFVVQTTASATQVYFSYGRTSGIAALNTGRTPQFYYNSSGNLVNDLFGASAISDGGDYRNAYVLSEVTGGSTFTGYDNGTLFSGTNGINITLNTLTSFAQVGAGQLNGEPTFYLTGQIAEVIGYNRVVSTTERQQLEFYLANKWGLLTNLDAGNPYKTAPLYILPPAPVLQIPNRAVGVSRYYDIDTPIYQIFNYSQFGAGSNISVFGNASFLNNEIQLTPNSASQVGSAFYQKKVLVTKTFQTTFRLRFESTQADGSAFVLQNLRSNAIGGTGGGVGYSGIGSSVAIIFDTYNGAGGQFSIDFQTNGTTQNQGVSGVLNATLGLTAGQTWSFLVVATYNGTALSYTITNTANGSNYTASSNVNITNTLGSSNGWIGFTSATGGATEGCFLSAWNWSNAK